MTISAKLSGVIKPSIGVSVHHGGIIKPAIGGWVHDAGIWKPMLNPPISIGTPVQVFNTGDASTYTGTVAIGDAPLAGQTRHVLFMATMPLIENNPQANIFSLGGVTATKVMESETVNGVSASYAGGWIIEMPTGTTAAYSYTGKRAARGCGLSFVPIYNMISATPVATAINGANSTASLGLSLTSGGSLILGCVMSYNGGTLTVTGDATEYAEGDTNSADNGAFFSNDAPLSGARSITVTTSSTPSSMSTAAVAFA